MRVIESTDPRSFLAAAEPLLLADEPRHNLIYGILATLVDQPGLYEDFRLWRVDDAGRTVGVALRTLPFPMLLAQPLAEGVLPVLASYIAKDPERLSGVSAATPEALEFAECYLAATGLEFGVREEQGIYALTAVEDVPGANGSCRRAGPADRELMLEWMHAFHVEAGVDIPWDDEQVRRRMDIRLGGESELGLWIWEDGEIVSLTGYGSPTPNGIRIGPVYTPPELRGRGYATSLVAAVSADLLARGRRFCFLYTDMANPTSNAIYRRIGYRLVCGSLRLMFD